MIPGYKHVGYVNAFDEEGKSIFAKIVYEFIQSTTESKGDDTNE